MFLRFNTSTPILIFYPSQQLVSADWAGYTVSSDLASPRARVRRETIVFLEKGKYNPSLKLAHDVAVSLGASIDELFLWDEKEGE